MNNELTTKLEEVYESSEVLKVKFTKEKFMSIMDEMMKNKEIIENYFLDYDFLCEVDSYFKNNVVNTIHFLEELHKKKVITVSRVLTCSNCSKESILSMKELTKIKRGLNDQPTETETMMMGSDCLNCYETTIVEFLPNLSSEKEASEYQLVFTLSPSYSSLVKEVNFGIQQKKSILGGKSVFSQPLKTRSEHLNEKKDPDYAKKKHLKEGSKNPLNFSVWHTPMVSLLEGNGLIQSIPSVTIPLTVPVLNGVYEGNFDDLKDEFLSIIPQEWLNKEELFIRTGAFSNKFNFKQPHVQGVAENLADSYLDIAYTALMYGADRPTEIVLREFIQNKGNRPTIYHGMPLNTEFRYFYDFDKEDFVGVANYWHPDVMINGLKNNAKYDEEAAKDLETYEETMDIIKEEFKEDKKLVAEHLKNALLKNKEATGYRFKGIWSIDIMKSGDDYYFIDMALGDRSALIQQIEEI